MSSLEKEIDQEDLDAMDKTFAQSQMLFMSRCVSMPGNNNVTVREIPSKKEGEKE